MSSHPVDCGAAHAETFDRVIEEIGPANVAAFIAEPVAGATLAAAVPSDDYWPAMTEVCRRHGVLLIADEVMTGFGRTGRWFGLDHWGVRPDILVAGKGSTSGYWPFGFAATSDDVFETVRPNGFVHGFTWSHNGVGAAVAHATLRRLRQADLVNASRAQGERLLKELTSALADVAVVGDVRGLGLMIGVELVADRTSKAPFARAEQVTERVLAAARDDGLLLYSSTGHVDGVDGDLLVLGPPFVITDEECALVVERTRRAIDRLG
jgi:adenosylmethionine-8-amino-7-oxononanoate aminotransferase